MWLSLLAGEQMGRLASHILYPPSEPSRLLQACPFIGQLHMESALSSNIVSANIRLARIQEEKGTTEDEKVGWHHRLDGHETEQAPGAGDRQGNLACCSTQGRKD